LKKMKKSMGKSPVMMEKPDDLTLEKCQEANFDLIMTLANQNLWHICEQIFGYLNYETVENCRKVSELWNVSLERIALITFLQEFGDRDGERLVDHVELDPKGKVSTIVAGWKKAAKEYGFQASLEELQEIKGSLQDLLVASGKCCEYPVHEAAIIGAVKLMEFILRTEYDLNAEDDSGMTVWHCACRYGQTETAQLLIKSPNEFGIDLNAKDDYGSTAWHWACCYGQTETAQLLIHSSKEFGINLNAKDDYGQTGLHEACCGNGPGKTETVQMILKNWKEFGIDLNVKDDNGQTPWHEACITDHTEAVQMILKNWKEFGIDLNVKDNDGKTALHHACYHCRTETVGMILKNWKEFGIDIKAQDYQGESALDLIEWKGERWNPIKEMLEKEYSQIDVIESVQSLDLDFHKN